MLSVASLLLGDHYWNVEEVLDGFNLLVLPISLRLTSISGYFDPTFLKWRIANVRVWLGFCSV